MHCLRALLLLTLVPPLGADVVLLSAPDPSGVVSVLTADGGGSPAPVPGLTGIELLPIETSGRTGIERFAPQRARLEVDSLGTHRLVLPDQRGALYRYRRSDGPSVAYGFFLVLDVGAPTILIERVGTGGASDIDPFVDRVAVAPDGSAILIATMPAAGGQLLEVDLSGSSVDRAAGLGILEFTGSGLHLFATWGVAGGPDGLVRFSRSNDQPGELVDLGDPAWIGGEVVASPNGVFAATTAGSAPDAALVYAFSATGPALQVTSTEAALSPAGYLPEYAGGPYLAIDDTGSQVAFRTEGLTSREAWIARVQSAPFQVTSDSLYLETLDQIGVMRYSAGSLLLAVGEEGDPGVGIEGLDVYAVQASGGAPTISNLSQSNGLLAPPFFVASDIDPEYGMHDLPGSNWTLVHNSESSSGTLLALDKTAAAPTVVLENVKSLDLIVVAGDYVLVSLRRTLAQDMRQLVQLDVSTLTPTVLASVNDEIHFERAATRADGVVGLIVRQGVQEWLAHVDLSTGSSRLLLSTPLSYGPALGFDSDGALAFTVGVISAQTWPVLWNPQSIPMELAVLSGTPTGSVLPHR